MSDYTIALSSSDFVQIHWELSEGLVVNVGLFTFGKVPNSNRRSVNIGRFGRETGKRIASYDDALLLLCFLISLYMLSGSNEIRTYEISQ